MSKALTVCPLFIRGLSTNTKRLTGGKYLELCLIDPMRGLVRSFKEVRKSLRTFVVVLLNVFQNDLRIQRIHCLTSALMTSLTCVVWLKYFYVTCVFWTTEKANVCFHLCSQKSHLNTKYLWSGIVWCFSVLFMIYKPK